MRLGGTTFLTFFLWCKVLILSQVLLIKFILRNIILSSRHICCSGKARMRMMDVMNKETPRLRPEQTVRAGFSHVSLRVAIVQVCTREIKYLESYRRQVHMSTIHGFLKNFRSKDLTWPNSVPECCKYLGSRGCLDPGDRCCYAFYFCELLKSR